MKTSISHLPESKQQELQRVTQLIVETVAPEKIILYGSYATGAWQEDRYAEKHLVYGFDSDYDILVITKTGDRRKDYEISSQLTNRSRYRVPINVITHDMEYINKQLAVGQYFFTEIIKQGILLFDARNEAFSQSKELSSAERKAVAKRDFDKWLTSARTFLKGAKFYLSEKDFKNSVFELHQAAERTYNTVMLVFTGYKPKTHNLDKLRNYTKKFSESLIGVFPLTTKEEEHLFDLLQKGYIDARYSDDYLIKEEELNTLISRVSELQNVTEKICQSKIDSFE
jgi:uncharacterized protein